MKKALILLLLFVVLSPATSYPADTSVYGGVDVKTGDFTATGTIKTEQYFIFDSISEPTCPSGKLCLCHDGTNVFSWNGTSYDDLTASGSGYWSLSGSNIYYNAGTIAVGSAAPNSSYNIYIDETSDTVIAGVFSRVKGTDVSTPYYGVNGTASGVGALENIGIYGYATSATTNWAGKFMQDVYVGGDLVIQNGELINNRADGLGVWNFCNSVAYSGTDIEGNTYCNYTDNTVTSYFDGTEYEHVMTDSTATTSGVPYWGSDTADDTAADTGTEVCALHGRSCSSTYAFADSTQYVCSAVHNAGAGNNFIALCY